MLFPDDRFPDACNNTLKIAERVHYQFNFDQDYLPDFQNYELLRENFPF